MLRASFLLTIIVLTALFASCSYWRGNGPEQENFKPPGEIHSNIPFETKEPEIYQCEIIVTTFLNGEKSERVVKAARNGAKMRYDYPKGISFMQISENETYLIQNEAGIYVQSSNIDSNSTQPGDELRDFLTAIKLNERRDVKFEKLESENNLTKYRVVIDESTNSEINVFVDETLKLPVRQEFFQSSGTEKKLVSSMELRNFVLQADQTIFEIPKAFRQVSVGEYQKELQTRRK